MYYNNINIAPTQILCVCTTQKQLSHLKLSTLQSVLAPGCSRQLSACYRHGRKFRDKGQIEAETNKWARRAAPRARNAANGFACERLQRVCPWRGRIPPRPGSILAAGTSQPRNFVKNADSRWLVHLRGAADGQKAQIEAEIWRRRKRVRSRFEAVFTGGGVAGGRNWPRVVPQAQFGHYHVRLRPKIEAACDFLGEGQARRRGLAGRWQRRRAPAGRRRGLRSPWAMSRASGGHHHRQAVAKQRRTAGWPHVCPFTSRSACLGQKWIELHSFRILPPMSATALYSCESRAKTTCKHYSDISSVLQVE